MSVYRKLMQARIALQSRKMTKSGLNKFAGYNYFELGDFLPTTMEIFNEVGLCGVVSYQKDIATLTITDIDGGGEIVVCSPMSSAALKGLHEVQNLGAVQSYLRRYLWVTAMEIVEHDALDATTGKDKPVKIVHTPTQGAADAVSEDDKQYLQEMAVECIAMVAQGNPSGARERIEVDMLDTEQKTYLWTLLDSKTRSAIKAAKQ